MTNPDQPAPDESFAQGVSAADLLPQVYEQLRAAAEYQMRQERAGHTLQPTALVHEAFLKIMGDRKLPWQNRQHFYVAAAQAMRQVLLDHARSRKRRKRGGDQKRVALHVSDVAESWDYSETLSLNEAMEKLALEDPGIADTVQLRFFAGLTIEETAQTLGLSAATVKRRWELGRTWLFRELSEGDGSS